MNQDFGSIFSTLLPGADARLAPPEGCGVLDGLEFKVALGNTWKDNLTELSGGQRSGDPNAASRTGGFNSVRVVVTLTERVFRVFRVFQVAGGPFFDSGHAAV